MSYPIRVRATALVIERDSILLVEYRDEEGVHYNLPGGGVEPGESVTAGVHRELMEETMLEATVGPIAFVYEYAPHLNVQDSGSDIHTLYLVFECTPIEGSRPRFPDRPDGDQSGVRWIPLAELDGIILYPNIKAHIKQFAAERRTIELIEDHQLEPYPRQVELRELKLDEDNAIYQMIQEIGEGQNGFVNSLYSNEIAEFKAKLRRNFECAQGLNLQEGYVPQTIYWLYVQGKPVGYGKLRHHLNDRLLEHGGHIGYVIRPSARGNGYGNILLREILDAAREKGIPEVLLTCNASNTASRKVIEANQGILTETTEDSCKYWIQLFS
ncbi:GNAT family N-acetyltransferase [Paenibacillus terrigena]|uniref:GNAT family N-acetyltransferase n=1 Tax=Paenibacillus terrigena TaxID=369333 RepID=UPI00037CE066